MIRWLGPIALATLMTGQVVAQTPLGDDASACARNVGPAIRVNVVGLKDRTGRL
jgi:hypothetical protein